MGNMCGSAAAAKKQSKDEFARLNKDGDASLSKSELSAYIEAR